MSKRSVFAALFVGWLVLCRPWFLSHYVVPWDSKDQFYPFAKFISNSIHSGDSPFWNPYAVRVHLSEYRNTEVAIEIESSRDAIIELHDPYYFPWRAYVDGKPREILQSNYMFRGVHIRPCERHLIFRFEPFAWTAIRQTLFRSR